MGAKPSYIKPMLKRIFTSILGAGLLLTPLVASAATDAVYTSWRNNIAADGYDVVTFFSGKPQQGKAEFTAQYEGAEWVFFSQANKDLFLTNPELFAPQYGGHCAWAIAKGKVAPGKPDHWFVEDGRLFFNYNARIKRRWEKKRATYIQSADKYWLELKTD